MINASDILEEEVTITAVFPMEKFRYLNDKFTSSGLIEYPGVPGRFVISNIAAQASFTDYPAVIVELKRVRL